MTVVPLAAAVAAAAVDASEEVAAGDGGVSAETEQSSPVPVALPDDGAWTFLLLT